MGEKGAFDSVIEQRISLSEIDYSVLFMIVRGISLRLAYNPDD